MLKVEGHLERWLWRCNGPFTLHTHTGQCYVDKVLYLHDLLIYQIFGNIILFQKDIARPHTCNMARNCVQASHVNTLDWASRPPDLSPTKHLFDILGLGYMTRSTSYGVYISQLIRFARASSYVTDFNTRNKLLTQKLLKQGYRYHKLRKTFSKFYRRYFDLISKFQVGLKSFLRQGLSQPDFYGDLVYKLKKIVGSNNFSAQFIKIISHYKKIGYNINVLQQTACLVVNPITVGNFAFLFNCTPVGRTSDSMMVPT